MEHRTAKRRRTGLKEEEDDGSFLYIHAKMILADYGAAQAAAFLGSENFSRTSLDRNRELGILVTETPILDRLHQVFEQDWGITASSKFKVSSSKLGGEKQ
ncbi:MAG: phospholipase D-like domain-containing protein [Lentisphaerota bacterium]